MRPDTGDTGRQEAETYPSAVQTGSCSARTARKVHARARPLSPCSVRSISAISIATRWVGAATNGASASLVDFDMDGRLDVLVIDRTGNTRLYRNDTSNRLFDYTDQIVGAMSDVSDAALTVGDRPLATPSGTATSAPSRKPVKTVFRLVKIWSM